MVNNTDEVYEHSIEISKSLWEELFAGSATKQEREMKNNLVGEGKDFKIRHLLRNAIITPDGTLLESRNRHDYTSHVDSITGEVYFLDGGTDYIRCSTNINDPRCTQLFLYSDDDHEKIREGFLWRTYGKNGDLPGKNVQLGRLSDEHIGSIFETQAHLPFHIRKIFNDELEYRVLRNIQIEDKGVYE